MLAFFVRAFERPRFSRTFTSSSFHLRVSQVAARDLSLSFPLAALCLSVLFDRFCRSSGFERGRRLVENNREWRSKKLLYLYLGHPFFCRFLLSSSAPTASLRFSFVSSCVDSRCSRASPLFVLQLSREHLSIKSVCSLVIDSLSRRSMQRFPRRSVSLAPFCS